MEAWLLDLDECDRQLAVAAIVTEEMRAAVLRQCDFHCSAGIAHNKVTFRLQPRVVVCNWSSRLSKKQPLSVE